MPYSDEQLRKIHTFKDLLHYLEEKLDWPLHEYQFDELTFEYQPEELGLKEEDAAKVKTIHQLRPLHQGQPWGIFFVEFENKKLPVVVLRRILSHLVVKKRASANKAGEAAWHAEDLLFITTFGEDDSTQREIAFAHFHQSAGDLPTLHVLGWDGGDTPLKLAYLDSDLQQHLCWPDNTADHRAWRQQWAVPFRHRIGHVIRTADALAEVLAALARGINEKAIRMLAVESENGPLRMLYKAFQSALIHDLTEENFADTYAQTITYGLLTAAISRTDLNEGRHGTFIIAENVTDMVPITNPFLKEMLQTFLKVGGRKGGIDFDELGIQDVVELLRGDETDLPEILRDFGNRTPGEDPVIHFYEHFLSAYNKKLKIQRGVFYTPQSVVSYIIRSVHELLQTEFGLEDGLASTITWGEMIKRHPDMKLPILTKKNPSKPGSKDILISPESPFVMILDIATGTGTFLVETIEIIHRTMTAKWQKQGKREQEIVTLWNEYVPKHLLPRLYGYELMMAPYAIAHMKIGLKLSETGYKFISNERVRVYLTNTLEPPSDAQQQFVGILPALAHEAEAVNAVKLNVRFTVLVGNPPYSNFGMMNKIPWILDLLDDYKRNLNEKKINLDDDFIKFVRYAHFKIEETRIGVVGIITNNVFLDGMTHRKMRECLLESFDLCYIVNLHGNVAAKETTPDGEIDGNVFEIKQGVSISIMANLIIRRNDKAILHKDYFGSRNIKYNLLNELNKLLDTFVKLPSPIAPNYLFVPRDISVQQEFLQNPSTEQFGNTMAYGIQTKQDDLFIAFSRDELAERINEVINDYKSIGASKTREKYGLGDSSGWSVERLKRINFDQECIKRVMYRPFDVRWIYYEPKSLGRARYGTMKHMLMENIGLVIMRQVFQNIEQYNHFGVSNALIDERTFYSNRGGTYLIPLYIMPDDETKQTSLELLSGRKHNITLIFAKQLADALKLELDSVIGLPKGLTPEDIFHYSYSSFHSATYRARYAELLKTDFPRVPLTSNLELFRAFSKLGGELVALHLLESPKVDNFITHFNGNGDNSIPKKPTWKDNAVWINPTQRFEGVPENVWNFQIGGYQVCEKWLKDRKGRTLSAEDIAHYQRIVVALSETIRIMAEIDKVINEHGGWPGAFI